jgi:hypothetical protein
VADFDPRPPSIARVYDYILGSKDNFAADRQVAERLMAAAPLTVHSVQEFASFFGPLELVTPGDGREWASPW